MIEVEKKFSLSEENKKTLIQGAKFLGTKNFTDTYYDSATYTLTCADIWLRLRGDTFELKVAFYINGDKRAAQYHEFTTDKEIRTQLQLPTNGTLAEVLKDKGYYPFATFTNTRTQYTKEGFAIDLDIADFGDFTHSICEIELTTDTTNNATELVDKIMDFATRHKLESGKIRGKLMEYIYRKRPEHYQALVDAGVVWDPQQQK